MFCDGNKAFRRSNFPGGSDPLDQAQCNFFLLCLAQQIVPLVAIGKFPGLPTKGSDPVAQAIDVGRFVHARILPVRGYP